MLVLLLSSVLCIVNCAVVVLFITFQIRVYCDENLDQKTTGGMLRPHEAPTASMCTLCMPSGGGRLARGVGAQQRTDTQRQYFRQTQFLHTIKLTRYDGLYTKLVMTERWNMISVKYVTRYTTHYTLHTTRYTHTHSRDCCTTCGVYKFSVRAILCVMRAGIAPNNGRTSHCIAYKFGPATENIRLARFSICDGNNCAGSAIQLVVHCWPSKHDRTTSRLPLAMPIYNYNIE